MYLAQLARLSANKLTSLGVYVDKGSVRCINPHHEDSHPSLKIYDESGAYCHACGSHFFLDEIVAQHLNISITQAKKKLGITKGVRGNKATPGLTILDKLLKPQHDFTEQYNQLDDLDDYAKKWLDGKGILKPAIKMGWKLHRARVFDVWSAGVVIPYFWNKRVVYVRYRRFSPHTDVVDKPIGLPNVSPLPYFNIGEGAKRVHICEGESDTATVVGMGGSAVGIPGASQMRCIATALYWLRGKEIVIVADNDTAGEDFRHRIKMVARALNTQCADYPISKAYNDLNDAWSKQDGLFIQDFNTAAVPQNVLEVFRV